MPVNEELLSAVTARVLEKLSLCAATDRAEHSDPDSRNLPKALLIGTKPAEDLGYGYVSCEPYEAVVLGSLTTGQLLCFHQEQALTALLEGKPVYLYLPGINRGTGKNRHLEAELVSALNRLKSWGVVMLDGGGRKRLVTAQEAMRLKAQGLPLPQECILTPSARDILS